MTYAEQLHRAITKGNAELCQELIHLGAEVNDQVNNKFAICLASEYDQYEIVEILIRAGADVDQFDFYDQSCLMYAVSIADLRVVQLLVGHGAGVNRCDSNGVYPFHIALNRKNDEICDYLLAEGALFNEPDLQGSTPLAIAVNSDYVYMITKLLKLGADPNVSDSNGDTPLIKAIWSTMSTEIEKIQILNTVKDLVLHGAEINAKNEAGRTALFTAIYQNNTEIALFLINNGAKCQLEDRIMSNFTLLHYVVFQGNYTLTKALLEKKCDPNYVATSCESPIYIAVTKGYLDIIGLLVEYGANVNLYIGAENDNKCTALQASVYYLSEYDHFKKIVDKLLEGNVDLTIAQPGPILYICLQYNKINFAKYLVSAGADVEQRTVFGQSCFYKAFLTKNLEFMQLCIMAGFNLCKMEPWIKEYLENPDFIDYADYYVKRATNTLKNRVESRQDESLDETELQKKTDQEINEMIYLDEYFAKRFQSGRRGGKNQYKNSAEQAKYIYAFIKHTSSNPLTLKELSRISVRDTMLKNKDFKMKFKIDQGLHIPQRLKDYLLFKEFDL